MYVRTSVRTDGRTTNKGGKVGRKKGSVKTKEQKAEEYRDIIAYLKNGYSIRVTAKLTEKSISTVQRVKKDFQL